MHVRFLYSGLFAAGLGLVACSGGSTTTLPSAPGPGPSATIPVSTPTPYYPPHPAGTGDTFTFGGTLSQHDTYTYPQPSPLPATSVSANVTQGVTVSATVNPFGSGTVSDFHTVEADAYSTQTLSTTTDYYYQTMQAAFTLLGYNAVDDAGDKTVVQYTTPQVIDELPEAGGATWTNSPAATIAQSFPSGEAANRTIDANGGYTDTTRLSGTDSYPATSTTLTANDDGSAEFSIVFHENGRAGYPQNEDAYDNYILSKPQMQAANTYAIAYSYQTYTVIAPATTPSPASTPVPESSFVAWYTVPLYKESDVDNGSVTIPSSCNAPAGFGKAAMQLEQTIKSVDPALGTITQTTTDQYVVAGFGPVCVNVASTVNAYYDYSGDNAGGPQNANTIVYQGTQPLHTTTISEELTLATQGAYTLGKRSTMSLQPISSDAIAGARVSVAQSIERMRLRRLRTLVAHIYVAAHRKGSL